MLCLWLIAVSAAYASSDAISYKNGEINKDSNSDSKIEIVKEDWLDQKRNRSLPVKIYHPRTSNEKCPIIIFSHGLGGSREAAQYLGQAWANNGYFCVFVQHPGSDKSLWEGSTNKGEIVSVLKTSINPRATFARVKDISFVIDQINLLNQKDTRFSGKLDPEKIGIAGHSFGGWTSLAMAGQSFGGALGDTGRSLSFGDPRIKAAIYLSPPAYRGRMPAEKSFGTIAIPGMVITGSQDTDMIVNAKPEDRAKIFDYIKAPHQYLLFFEGAAHQTFGGRRRPGPQGGLDSEIESFVSQSTVKFWDAYLRSDPKARAWLDDGQLASTLGNNARVSIK